MYLKRGNKMINLYYLSTCPYCKRVIDFLDEKNIEYKLLDINEQENFNKLLKIGKKKQVPFIVDTNTGIVMYESNDIIKYLTKEYL